MRVTRYSVSLLAALTMWLVAGPAPTRAADEPNARPNNLASEYLVPQSEIVAIRLSIVDEKLALSWAVETHIQIELATFALAGIRHEDVKDFTERKLQHYRQVFNTLDELTGGRAGKVLARATRNTGVKTTSDNAAATAGNSRPARRGRKGGIGAIVQNATENAILRVRLAIGQEYAQLLRVELETSPPEEFDRRYASVEGFNQMQVLATLRVFEQQASPGFAQIVHLATVAAESQASEGRQVIEQFKNLPLAPPVNAGNVVSAALEKS